MMMETQDEDLNVYFVNCFRLILTGTDSEVNEGWTKVRNLENDPIWRQLKNRRDILRKILHSRITNVNEVPKVLIWFAKYLTEESSSDNPILDDIAQMLKDTKITDINHLTMILEVLLEHNVYLLESANHSKLCEAVVTSLSTLTVPMSPKKREEFDKANDKVQNFLRIICFQSRNTDSNNLIVVCLETLYKIISDTKRKDPPGAGLITVMETVNPSFIPQAVNCILLQSRCDFQLAQAIKTLCSWLPKSSGDYFNIWIMEFIKGLEKQRKYWILSVVTNKIVNVTNYCLGEPVIRKSTSTIIYYVLQRQGFKSLIPDVVETIQRCLCFLKEENTESSNDCIQNLVDIVKAMALRFPYFSVYEELQNSCPVAPRMHVVQDILCKGPLWVDETKEINPVSNLVIEDTVNESLKTHLGKVGLSNLGNTCYMNSVLQALFMTKQFCHEVLTHKPLSENDDHTVLWKLQNLFSLLLFSRRISLEPSEILLALSPDYFLPGEQQDSSEFLGHLLDLLYDHEKKANANNKCDGAPSNQSKAENGRNNISLTDEAEGTIKRWTTKEDLIGGALHREAQSPNPNSVEGKDSHSQSTGSRIQTEEDKGPNHRIPLVQRVLGGKSKITYHCAKCDTSSHNIDQFRDLQLCFPVEIQQNQEVSVQDLINYYLMPEKLTGDNRYRCDKCKELCDAQRIIKVLEAPTCLILILKRVCFDPNTGVRSKLLHKVLYNKTIILPVANSSCTSNETYQLYAAVVHSGYNMQYGHFFTYARDSNQNWFKFDDSYVSEATFNDFTNLQSPDTPYILFYEKSSSPEGVYKGEKPELSTLSKRLQDIVAKDTIAYTEDLRHLAKKLYGKRFTQAQPANPILRNENSDDENPPPSTCRGGFNMPIGRFLY